MSIELNRRDFLKKAGLVLSGSIIAGSLLTKSVFAAIEKNETNEEKENDIAPDEDLMREHGVLRRVILIYREIIHRINEKRDASPVLITKSASIIRHFIEDYHEKLEENYLFPRFEKAGQLLDLVSILRSQHQVGRKLTDQILAMAASKPIQHHPSEIVALITQFIRMYEPHAAREDTVLFPALRKIVSDTEYKEMGEQFEEEEHKLFGKKGFEGIVSEVAEIEKALDIYDLAQFTPKINTSARSGER